MGMKTDIKDPNLLLRAWLEASKKPVVIPSLAQGCKKQASKQFCPWPCQREQFINWLRGLDSSVAQN